MGESSLGKKGPEAGAGFLEAEAVGDESREAEASGASETSELGFFIGATFEHRGSAATTPPSGDLSG